ncbi:ATP-binding protein [Streptomyces sp. NPDC050732]|uniref:ATP-binding protein n=1 Tax=Streptomyces sp. NPDC050732 TaxID=3154632 RepID=UPI00343FB92F
MAVMARAGTKYQQHLTANPVQIRRTRRIVTALLRYWGWDEQIDPALLCVTELLTNVFRHACCENCELRLEASPLVLRIVVSDRSHDLPVVREAEPLAEGGRGMSLIVASADAWGADPTDAGKDVWAEFRAGHDGAAA